MAHPVDREFNYICQTFQNFSRDILFSSCLLACQNSDKKGELYIT
jgi:hypothetical protein